MRLCAFIAMDVRRLIFAIPLGEEGCVIADLSGTGNDNRRYVTYLSASLQCDWPELATPISSRKPPFHIDLRVFDRVPRELVVVLITRQNSQNT